MFTNSLCLEFYHAPKLEERMIPIFIANVSKFRDFIKVEDEHKVSKMLLTQHSRNIELHILLHERAADCHYQFFFSGLWSTSRSSDPRSFHGPLCDHSMYVSRTSRYPL